MPIHPLPQFESDLADYLQEKEDREAYEKLNAPSTIVVRFGYLKMVGEFPYSGDSKPGCGSKLVVKTHRGVELGEMLTSTCKNSGCSKSVSRKEMLEYIENSGGRQYPFYDRGRVLRIATVDDLNNQQKIEQRKNELRMIAKEMVEQSGLEMSIIEAEPILGNERVVFYFSAEDRVDFRDLVSDLSRKVGTKVELRQIGARDEARITADYERCGQYCCCKNFLKVLKPVSMKSAKVQKATLDPLKISGRCGRLMCCLRYEDETYDELRKNLPHRKSRVGTPEGDGIVISTQILTQLALVRLDNNTDVAIPIEDLTEPESKTAPEPGARRSSSGSKTGSKTGSKSGSGSGRSKREGSSRDRSGDSSSDRSGNASGKRSSKRRRPQSKANDGADSRQDGQVSPEAGAGSASAEGATGVDRPKKKRRRRRRSGSSGAGSTNGSANGSVNGQSSPSTDAGGSSNHSTGTSETKQGSDAGSGSSGPKKKRKRRRRRPSGNTDGGGPKNSDGGSSGGSSDSGSSDSGSSGSGSD